MATGSLPPDAVGEFRGAWGKKYVNLSYLFRDDNMSRYFRLGVIGDGDCFFHSLLATDHHKLPHQFRGYLDQDTSGRRLMAASLRRYLADMVMAVVGTESEGEESARAELLVKSQTSWVKRYFDYTSRSDPDAVGLLARDLFVPRSWLSQDAAALVYAVFGIPVILVIVAGNGIQNDTTNCPQIPFNFTTVSERIVLIAHVDKEHFEPIFQRGINSAAINGTHAPDSAIINRIKQVCL